MTHQRPHRRTSRKGLKFKAGLKTLNNSSISRYKGVVGKKVGPQIYIHKNYVHMKDKQGGYIIDQELLKRAERIFNNLFDYNSVMYDTKKRIIRFDEAPDFDTCREPHVKRNYNVYIDKPPLEGKSSDSIWHHKWMWVMDDYRGFDVEASKRWSAKWLAKVHEIAKSSDKTWRLQLIKWGVKNNA